jgi:hypothetical protein
MEEQLQLAPLRSHAGFGFYDFFQQLDGHRHEDDGGRFGSRI